MQTHLRFNSCKRSEWKEDRPPSVGRQSRAALWHHRKPVPGVASSCLPVNWEDRRPRETAKGAIYCLLCLEKSYPWGEINTWTAPSQGFLLTIERPFWGSDRMRRPFSLPGTSRNSLTTGQRMTNTQQVGGHSHCCLPGHTCPIKLLAAWETFHRGSPGSQYLMLLFISGQRISQPVL